MTAQIPGIDPKAEDEEEIACSGIDSLLHGASFLLAPARPAQLLRTLAAAHSWIRAGKQRTVLRARPSRHRGKLVRVSGRGPINFFASYPLVRPVRCPVP